MLCELINEALHKRRGKPGQSRIELLLLWVWGKAMLYFLENSTSIWRKKWSAFFKANGINSSTYSKELVDWRYVSYVKISLFYTKAYVGSSSQGMGGREASRRRKFQQRTCAGVEPAILWWREHGCFWKFCPIVWARGGSKVEAVYSEAKTIDCRKPELNAPFIWQFLKSKSRKFQPNPKCNGRRWVRRAHKLSGRVAWLHFVPPRWQSSDVSKIWRTIAELTVPRGNTCLIMRRLLR